MINPVELCNATTVASTGATCITQMDYLRPTSQNTLYETVWKIAERFSTVRLWRQGAADRGSFAPSWRPSESRFATRSDFPNSFSTL